MKKIITAIAAGAAVLGLSLGASATVTDDTSANGLRTVKTQRANGL